MCHSVLVQQCYSMQFWVDFTKFAEALGIEKRNCFDFGVIQARFWILDPLQGFNQFPVSPIFTLLMFITYHICYGGGSVAEWLVCCGLRCRRAWVHIAAATLSDNSLRQTVHTHRASVRQAVKLVAALLRVSRVTAGLAESNGSLPPGL